MIRASCRYLLPVGSCWPKSIPASRSQQTLPPAELFARDEQAEERDQPVEDAAIADRMAKTDQSCRQEQPDCSPLDEAVLLHEHVVTIGREAPKEQHAQDPCRHQDVE